MEKLKRSHERRGGIPRSPGSCCRRRHGCVVFDSALQWHTLKRHDHLVQVVDSATTHLPLVKGASHWPRAPAPVIGPWNVATAMIHQPCTNLCLKRKVYFCAFFPFLFLSFLISVLFVFILCLFMFFFISVKGKMYYCANGGCRPSGTRIQIVMIIT